MTTNNATKPAKPTNDDVQTTIPDGMGIIELHVGTAFKKSFYYPANETAKLVLNLVNGNKQGNLKRTTFDKPMIDSCKALGFKVFKVPTTREIEEL